MVRESEKFCQNIQTIYREIEEEKEQTKLKKIYYLKILYMKNLFQIKIQLYLKHGIAHHGKIN